MREGLLVAPVRDSVGITEAARLLWALQAPRRPAKSAVYFRIQKNILLTKA
jgi:hypothetical protein